MPYKLTKTDGTTLLTVQDATVDNTTSLTFLGKNYTGYGPAVEENFLYLLENFASGYNVNPYVPNNPLLNPIQGRPITGQLWFNTGTHQLNVTPDGKVWKGIASLVVTTSTSNLSSTVSIGDMFWDGSYLTIWNGSQKTNIGPYLDTGLGSLSFVKIDSTSIEPSSPTGYQQYNGGITTLFDGTSQIPIAIYSNSQNYSIAASSSINTVTSTATMFTTIQRGITLRGTDPITGSSLHNNDYSSSYLLWGTASESITTRNITLQPASTSTVGYVPFSGPTVNGGTALTTSSQFTYNPLTGVINATATSAYYADLAERYESDAEYEVGTVLVIGGEKEVTVTKTYADTRVAGIVSKNPAYMMNAEAGTDATHPYIALKGRVLCKVVGPISKGDLLVTSAHEGYAAAGRAVGAVIGKALESHEDQGFGVIEVLIV